MDFSAASEVLVGVISKMYRNLSVVKRAKQFCQLAVMVNLARIYPKKYNSKRKVQKNELEWFQKNLPRTGTFILESMQ